MRAKNNTPTQPGVVRQKRTRGDKLTRMRLATIAAQPLCPVCEGAGRVEAGVELDHVVPLFKGGTDDPDNRQMLCREHHRQKTARDLGRVYHPPVGPDGWPVESDEAID